jgi:hypothetical protein
MATSRWVIALFAAIILQSGIGMLWPHGSDDDGEDDLENSAVIKVGYVWTFSAPVSCFLDVIWPTSRLIVELNPPL